MRSTTVVRPARTDDATAVATIYCDTLGAGYITPDAVREEIATRPRCLYVVAEVDGAVQGAANAIWVERAEVLDLGVIGYQRVQVELLELGPHADRFGLLENVGVLPPHRGRGLGTQLVARRMEWLRQQRAGAVYSFAWHTPQGCPAAPALERAGFRRIRELADFYLEDGLQNGYACPFCGRECHCSAILYFRNL